MIGMFGLHHLEMFAVQYLQRYKIFFVVFNVWCIVRIQTCEIVNAVATKDSPTTLALQWQNTLQCFTPTTYIITAKHLKYEACKGNWKGRLVEDLNYFTNQTFVVLEGLIAFSSYEISILDSVNKVSFEIKNITTAEDLPKFSPSPGLSLVFTTAITFYWNSSTSDQCHLRFGRENGFRAELWGLDPWVTSSKPLMESNTIKEFLPEFYAHNLEPYTNYRLKVFVQNYGGKYNPNDFLDLRERTLPNKPEPPTSVIAARVSSQVARLKWTVSYPPTGQVKNFTVRVGEKIKNETIWKRRIFVDAITSICQVKSYCYSLHNILDNSTYIFQVRVHNENVDTPSEFSSGAIIEALESPIDPGKDIPIDAKVGMSSMIKVLVIIFTLTAVVLVVLLTTAFYYKIKLKKLKIIFDHSRSQFYTSTRTSIQLSDSSTPRGFDGNGYPQLLSFEKSPPQQVLPNHVLGTVRFLRGSSEASTYDQPIFSQIFDIQSRRLPEPPPKNPDQQEKRYLSVPNPANPNPRIEQHFFRRCESYDKDRSTDMDGYLRPTFRPTISMSEENFKILFGQDPVHSSLIPPISYERVSPNYDVPRNPPQVSVTKDTFPLISG